MTIVAPTENSSAKLSPEEQRLFQESLSFEAAAAAVTTSDITAFGRLASEQIFTSQPIIKPTQ